MGTLHAGSAIGTISKLLGYFNSQEREGRLQSLSENLVGIIHQTLIPKKESAMRSLSISSPITSVSIRAHSVSWTSCRPALIEMRTDLRFATSIRKLVQSGVIEKADALKAVSGNAFVYDNVRQS